MTADCIRHAVLDTYCEIYFSFFVFGRKWQVFFVFVYFSAEKENLFFGYFYFTAKKVKFIFGRPLVGSKQMNSRSCWNVVHVKSVKLTGTSHRLVYNLMTKQHKSGKRTLWRVCHSLYWVTDSLVLCIVLFPLYILIFLIVLCVRS